MLLMLPHTPAIQYGDAKKLYHMLRPLLLENVALAEGERLPRPRARLAPGAKARHGLRDAVSAPPQPQGAMSHAIATPLSRDASPLRPLTLRYR